MSSATRGKRSRSGKPKAKEILDSQGTLNTYVLRQRKHGGKADSHGPQNIPKKDEHKENNTIAIKEKGSEKNIGCTSEKLEGGNSSEDGDNNSTNNGLETQIKEKQTGTTPVSQRPAKTEGPVREPSLFGMEEEKSDDEDERENTSKAKGIRNQATQGPLKKRNKLSHFLADCDDRESALPPRGRIQSESQTKPKPLSESAAYVGNGSKTKPEKAATLVYHRFGLLRKAIGSPRHSSTPKFSSSETKTIKKRSRKTKIDNDDNQPIIDAGQKELGPIQCEMCKMFYHPKHGDDVAAHEKFHSENFAIGDSKTYTIPPHFKKTYRCQKFTEQQYKVWSEQGFLQGLKDMMDGKVVRIAKTASLPPILRKKIDETVDLVNEELGFVPCENVRNLWKHTRQVYLFLSIGRTPTIIGCTVVDTHIPKGGKFLLAPDPVSPTTTEEKRGGGGGERADTPSSTFSATSIHSIGRGFRDKHKAYRVEFGVNRIWTHAKFRGQGLAGKLLTTIRESFRPPIPPQPPVPKTLIAFTDPTEAGKKFMINYCNGPHNVLIYDVTLQP